MTRTRAIRAVAAVLALLAPWSGQAWAHAMLTSADPPVGSAGPAPAEVTLSFSEDIEPAFSRIEVRDAAGRPVTQGTAHAVPGRAARLAIAVPGLSPGVYKVIWHATSTDTHKTQGSFTFSVGP